MVTAIKPPPDCAFGTAVSAYSVCEYEVPIFNRKFVKQEVMNLIRAFEAKPLTFNYALEKNC